MESLLRHGREWFASTNLAKALKGLVPHLSEEEGLCHSIVDHIASWQFAESSQRLSKLIGDVASAPSPSQFGAVTEMLSALTSAEKMPAEVGTLFPAVSKWLSNFVSGGVTSSGTHTTVVTIHTHTNTHARARHCGHLAPQALPEALRPVCECVLLHRKRLRRRRSIRGVLRRGREANEKQ